MYGVCLVLVSSCCGALSHAFAKKALDGGLSTNAFLVLRSLTGVIATAVIFGVSCVVSGFPQMSLTTWGLAVMVGLLHPVLSNTLYFTGLKTGELSVMSPLINTSPFLTAVLAALIVVGCVVSSLARVS